MDETDEQRRKRKSREASARWKAKNVERVKAYHKVRRAANLDEMRLIDQEAKTKWREANRELSRARSNAYAAEHRAAEKARSAAWRVAYPDEVKRLSAAGRARRKEHWPEFLADLRARYHANPGPALERQKAAKAANPAKFLAYGKRHYHANKPRYLAHSAARRARRLLATPSWCDRAGIVRLYVEAQRMTVETGIPHEVDHIIPLRGKTVCGLHIPENMQIITATENRRKHNRLLDVGGQHHTDRPRIPATAAV